jgi:hypothetical protein
MTAATACQPETYASTLQELIEAGSKLAAASAARALRLMETGKDDAAGDKAASLFLRLWGAIRQTVALATRLTPAPHQPAPAPKPVAETKPAPAAPQPKTRHASPADVADTLAQLQARHLKYLLASGTHTQPIPAALAANGAPLAASMRA